MIYETPLAKYETDKKDKGQMTKDKGWRTLDRGQSSGLEGIDGHDAAIELPVIQVFCENCIAAKSFGSGDDLRIPSRSIRHG